MHIRNMIARRPIDAYEQLDTISSHPAIARHILESGCFVTGARSLNIRPPIDFDVDDRSAAYRLHAWDPVSFLLKEFQVRGEQRYFDAAYNIARDWMLQHQASLLTQDTQSGIQAALEDGGTKAWYDMGVGQRIYRLAYILDHLARDERCSDGEFETFWRSLVFHHELLSVDAFYRGHHNHGLYQALGQLAAARRFESAPGFTAYKGIATRRLSSLLERTLFQSGAHKEHSPVYHYMVLISLISAERAGLIESSYRPLLQRAESILSWMTMPNGSLAPIGDTDVKIRTNLSPEAEGFSDPGLLFQRTGGRVGSSPSSGVMAVHDAGYVFARIPDDDLPGESAAYLAQIAGFHSRTHKHSDHLSMIWIDRGHEVLIDPGRYGYGGPLQPPDSELFKQGFWYSDPRRIYVEKTRAHNCVEIDGRDYPRKGVKPFGSALLDAREEEGFVVTSCETRHFRTVRHWRGLVMKAGHFLLVLDWLHDKENTHDYRQWFHLAPEWVVAADGDGMRAVNGDEELRVVSLLPGGAFQPVVRGQTEPELLGWRSDKAESLVPSPCFSILQTENTAAFATLLVFGDTAEPDMAFSKVNATCRKGRFGWRDARGSHRLFFDRTSGEFHVTQKRGLKFW